MGISLFTVLSIGKADKALMKHWVDVKLIKTKKEIIQAQVFIAVPEFAKSTGDTIICVHRLDLGGEKEKHGHYR